MTFFQPLDLRHWLIDSLAGNSLIFYVLAFVVISILAARFRMPNAVFGAMVFVFAAMMVIGSGDGTGEIIKGVLLLGLAVLSFAWAKQILKI